MAAQLGSNPHLIDERGGAVGVEPAPHQRRELRIAFCHQQQISVARQRSEPLFPVLVGLRGRLRIPCRECVRRIDERMQPQRAIRLPLRRAQLTDRNAFARQRRWAHECLLGVGSVESGRQPFDVEHPAPSD